MRVAYLDAFGGLAGDMFLGALLDLGVDREALLKQLESLGLPGWRWRIDSTRRRQLACTKVDFELSEDRDHRHLPEILSHIEGSTLTTRAKVRARAAFEALAAAEASAHGIPAEKVHFHEVGAADAILDICAVSAALDMLGIDRVYAGALPGGSGTVKCAHGEMPCPVPAVVNLLGDFELQLGRGRGEMVTPTGAALLVAWGAPLPEGLELRLECSGYGAGTRQDSVLRVAIGDTPEEDSGEVAWARDEVWEFHCQVDDISGEALAFGLEQVFAAGALDAYATPIIMKKGRPAHAITVLSDEQHRHAVLGAAFRHLGTLGVREQRRKRWVLEREIRQVQTRWGKVAVKVANGVPRPEYEDCAALAREHGVTLREVFEEVLRADVDA
jgi:uncharacterized protein (TIGR00299 family) protein